ncbi:uncharacterized protein LOC120354183 isoform X1 [Nilaparvata lugens]|uniref:uncharacterized protein LOC120354183 isoform X1 n=1 Tax=Nilaparvata lugens TaxID=108931 RepID=UPI00193E50ED|nr:uncharacterized protein LOC120354183 isoform X1 [Nilaparvata lugens]
MLCLHLHLLDQSEAFVWTVIANPVQALSSLPELESQSENDKLRESLMEVPWVDKPRWLRQTMHIMLTQANRDIQIKPYGIFTLNYMTFKDLMKFTFSVGNVIYTKKQLTSQTP